MSHKVRLGPIAIFLTIVAIVMATLAVLTTATTNADKVMAERFAEVTKNRYAMEAEAEKFIWKFDEQAAAGKIDAKKLGAKRSGEAYIKTIKNNGYILKTGVTSAGKDGGYKVTEWKLEKEWNADDPYSDVWKGE